MAEELNGCGHNVVLYYTILCYTILYYTILYYTWYYTTLHYYLYEVGMLKVSEAV